MAFRSSNNGSLTLLHIAQQQLGRDLEVDEKRLLLLLSPQGVAKFNNELSQGTDMNACLQELLIVYHGVEFRRKTAKKMLSQSAAKLIEVTKVQPTADEMIFLSNVPAPMLRDMIHSRLRGGNVLDDVIEDLALEYQHDQLASEADELAATQKIDVTTFHLPVVASNFAQSSNSAFPYAMFRCADRIRIGLSSVGTWFNERLFDLPLEELEAEATPVLIIQKNALASEAIRIDFDNSITTESVSSTNCLSASSSLPSACSSSIIDQPQISAEFPVLCIDPELVAATQPEQLMGQGDATTPNNAIVSTTATISTLTPTSTSTANARKVRFMVPGQQGPDAPHCPPDSPHSPMKRKRRLDKLSLAAPNAAPAAGASAPHPTSCGVFSALKARTLKMFSGLHVSSARHHH